MGRTIKRTGAALIALVIMFISVILFYIPAQADETADEQQPAYVNEDNTIWTVVGGLSELIYDYSLERTVMQRAAEAVLYHYYKAFANVR